MREKILSVIEKNSRIDIGELAVLLGEDEAALANEIANMEKVMKTASKQLAIFEKIKKEGKEDILTKKQKEFLEVRIENPELSIGDIAKKLRNI